MASQAKRLHGVAKYPRRMVDLIFRAFDYTTDGIVLGTLDGTIIYHNKAWLDIHGIDENEDQRGKRIREVERKELLPILENIRDEALKHGSFTYTFGTTRRDGKYHDVWVNANILRDIKPAVMVVILREVTELAQAQKELERRNEELALLNKIHRVMTTARNLKTVIRQMQKLIMDFIGSNSSGFFRVDYAKSSVVLLESIDLPSRLREIVKELPIAGSVFEQIMHSRGAYVMEEDMARSPSPDYNIRGRMGHARTIGFMFRTGGKRDYIAIYGISRPGDVPTETRRFLNAAAKEFGFAIERVEFMEELAGRQRELERRNKELAVLNKIHRVVTTSRSREAVIGPMQKLLMDFIGATVSAVFQVDPLKDHVVLLDSVGLPPRFRKLVERVPTKEPVFKKILHSKGVFVVEEDMSSRPASDYDFRHALGSKRTIGFVFRTGGRYDYMTIYSVTKGESDVTPEMCSVLDAAASQFGLAIGRVEFIEELGRRQRELERRNEELAVIDEIYTIIATAPTRKMLVRRMLKTLRDFIGAKAAGLFEIDRSRDRVALVDGMGAPPNLRRRVAGIPMSNPSFAWMVHAPGVVVVEEDIPHEIGDQPEIREALGLKRTIACAFSAGKGHDYQIVFGFDKDENVKPEIRRFLEFAAKRFGLGIERRDLLDSLKKNQKELKELTMRLIDSGEEEKRQLARLLHDDVGQTITGLRYEMDGLEKMLDSPSSCTRKSFEAIRKQLREVTESTRKVSRSLHPSMLDELGLVPTLTWYVDNFVRGKGLKVDSEEVGFDKRLPRPIAVTLYRVAQECLTNVVRHAGASHVKMRLTSGYPNVIMLIEDNGKGISTKKGKSPEHGLGLVSMRERVQLMGGTFEIKSRPGKGTKVRVEIPIEGTYGTNH